MIEGMFRVPGLGPQGPKMPGEPTGARAGGTIDCSPALSPVLAAEVDRGVIGGGKVAKSF